MFFSAIFFLDTTIVRSKFRPSSSISSEWCPDSTIGSRYQCSEIGCVSRIFIVAATGSAVIQLRDLLRTYVEWRRRTRWCEAVDHTRRAEHLTNWTVHHGNSLQVLPQILHNWSSFPWQTFTSWSRSQWSRWTSAIVWRNRRNSLLQYRKMLHDEDLFEIYTGIDERTTFSWCPVTAVSYRLRQIQKELRTCPVDTIELSTDIVWTWFSLSRAIQVIHEQNR